MSLRIRQLEALIAVADYGSITAAAAELGVSQPAVSRLLSDLSKELGFVLFDRKEGRLIPTQEVRFIQPDIRRVLELMGQIKIVSQEVNKHLAGHIKVACLPGFATSHLPEVVAQFLDARPGLTMTIEPDRPERILEWMIEEQYDFGITDGFSSHPAVDSQNINIRTVCIFPEKRELAELETISPADIGAEKIIHTRQDSEFFHRLSEAFLRADVPLHSHIEVRQFTAACELVCLGAGVSVVSELDASRYVGKGLKFRPFTPRLPHRISLVRPLIKRPSMVTLEFIDHFARSLAPFTD